MLLNGRAFIAVVCAAVSCNVFAVTDEQVFAFAEANYKGLFAGSVTAGKYQQYNFRYYATTGNYLAVDTNGVIALMGKATNGQISVVGPKTAFENAILAWEKTVTTPAIPTTPTTPAVEGVCSVDAAVQFGALSPSRRDICYTNLPAGFSCSSTGADKYAQNYMGYGAGYTYQATYASLQQCPSTSRAIDLGGDLAGAWNKVTPTLINSGLDMNAVLWDGTRFLSSASRFIVYSTNGVNWTQASVPSSGVSTLQGLATSGSVSVAVGASATLLYSSNGTSWQKATAPSGVTAGLARVVWAGGKFVAVGAGQTILSSTDGQSWSKQTAPAGSLTTGTLVDITWNGKEYYAVGYEGSSGYAFRSADGVTWTRQAMPTGVLPSAVVWDGSRYVLGATNGANKIIAISTDGINWTQSTINTLSTVTAFTVFGSRVLAVAGSGLFTSKNGGASWTELKHGADQALSVTNGRSASCSTTQCLIMGELGSVYSTF